MKQTKTLSGFRDLLPENAIIKQNIILKFQKILNNFGFLPIETPHIEYAETIINESEDETTKQIYKFKDHGKRDVALRFDHTVPLARFIGNHRHEIALPFKRYVIGNVFRGESPQVGRYREFTQCDFDIIGSKTIGSDCEIIQLINNCIESIPINDFVIEINHRLIIDKLIHQFLATEYKDKILQISDKIDKFGSELVIDQLVSNKIFDKGQAIKWINLISHKFESTLEMFNFILKNTNNNIEIKQLAEKYAIFDNILIASGIKKGNFIWNLSIMRGLEYYTGIVMETFIKSDRRIGSICSGGRYDQLTLKFCKEQYSGIGASIGVDRLLPLIMNQINTTSKSRLLLAVIDEDSLIDATIFAKKLRNIGIIVNIYSKKMKINKYFEYADKIQYNYLIVFGEQEVKEKKYILSNLKTGLKIKCNNWQNLINKIETPIKDV